MENGLWHSKSITNAAHTTININTEADADEMYEKNASDRTRKRERNTMEQQNS